MLSTLDSILNCKFYYIGMAIGLVKSVCKLGCISSNCVHFAELEEILPFIRACPPPYAPNWPKGEEEERMLELAGAIQYFFIHPRDVFWEVPNHPLNVVYSNKGRDEWRDSIALRVAFYLRLKYAAIEDSTIAEIDDGSIVDFGPQLVVPAVEIYDRPRNGPPNVTVVVKDIGASGMKVCQDLYRQETGKESPAPVLSAAMYIQERWGRQFDLTGLLKPGDKYWDHFNLYYDPRSRCFRNHNILVYNDVPGVPFPEDYEPPDGCRIITKSGVARHSVRAPD